MCKTLALDQQVQETANHSMQLGQLKGLSAGDMVNSVTAS